MSVKMTPSKYAPSPRGRSYQTGDSNYGRAVSDEVLKAYGTSESASQVAMRLGLPSRMVVIGMWARARTAGLIEKVVQAPKEGIRKEPADRVINLVKMTKPLEERPIRLDEPVPLNDGWGLSFDDLRPKHCKWPITHGRSTFYCGHPRRGTDVPYCPYHCQIAYTGIPKKKANPFWWAR